MITIKNIFYFLIIMHQEPYLLCLPPCSCLRKSAISQHREGILKKCIGILKHGYLCLRKISRKCCQDLSRWGNFHDTSHISLIKSYGVYFCVGENLRRRQYHEKRENYPHAKISTFTVLVKNAES